MGGSAPPPPDYKGAAEAQAQSSAANTLQQTFANRANQSNPWGTVSWDYQTAKGADGNDILDAQGNPVYSWSQTTKLDPRLQQALDSQMGLQNQRSQMAGGLYGNIANDIANAPDWNSFQSRGGGVNPYQLQTSIQGGDPYYQKAGDAYYNQLKSRLDPQWTQAEDQYKTQLENQGLALGDKAYDDAMARFGQQRNDAYGSANNAAATMAGQEAARMQGMDISAANFGNQALGQQLGQYITAGNYNSGLRDQQIGEQLQRQGWNLNLANGLLNGQQVAAPQFQGYNQATKADTTQYLNAAQMQGQYNLDAQAQKNQMFGDIMGAVGGLGSSAMMLSDERLKKNIHRLPFQVAPGIPLAEYEWKHKSLPPEIGVIAQDVEQVNPHAVQVDPATGYKKVDYEQVAPGLPFSVGGKKGARRG